MCYVLNRHLQYRFTKTVNLYESHTTRIKTTFAWLVRASTGVWNSVTWLHFEPKDTSPQPKIRSPLDFHNGNWMELSSSTVHRSEINMIKTKLWRNRGFIEQNLFASTSGNAASKCFRICIQFDRVVGVFLTVKVERYLRRFLCQVFAFRKWWYKKLTIYWF